MKPLILAGLLASSSLLCATAAAAQDRQPARALAQRAVAQTEIRAALADNQVQTTLRDQVRGIDTRQLQQAATRYSPPQRNLDIADVEADIAAPSRQLNTRQMNALAAPDRSRRIQAAPENLAPQPVRAAIAATSGNNQRVATSGAIRRATTATRPANPGLDLNAPPVPTLNVNGFGEAVHAALRNSTNGYTMRMRRGGQTIYTLQWNWAQNPGDGQRGWTPGRSMHIASISKFVTAVALLDLLDRRNIDFDTEIAQYLPDYWSLGPNVDDITFQELMNHTSGFSTGGSESSFSFMRQQVAQGFPASQSGDYDYENMNFGLMRILIATIGGYIDEDANFGPLFNNIMWDLVTKMAYVDYLEERVFGPAGVSGASLGSNNATAHGYTRTGLNGQDWGNLADWAGGAAWHMTADDVLDIASWFRRSGAPISRARASEALQEGYGVDGSWNTPVGRIYHKNGSWRTGGGCNIRRQVQSILFFLPEDMEVVVFVNSPIGATCQSLRDVIRTAYTNNIDMP
ncbi:serine hydrolase domain-containing protein [Maricaulis sp.]|uniref:serine hydrolase domain-containing protein n=1 Tax=Maricaulis sp. TaxID=1486257 RepID=UPI0026223243|nr:serine hydrolase domain-containing protein [Maricaulis sp.]